MPGVRRNFFLNYLSSFIIYLLFLSTSAEGGNLLADWELNEPIPLAIDTSGSSNNGINYGAVSEQEGHEQGSLCYGFDEAGEVVVVPDSDSLDISDDFLIECYIFPVDGAEGKTILSKEEVPKDFSFSIEVTDELKVRVLLSTNGSKKTSIVSGSTLTKNAWVKVEVERSGEEVNIWLDDTLDTSGTFKGTLFNSGATLRIGGSRVSAKTWRGKIDNVRIWDDGTLAGEWLLDEESIEAVDSSGYDNHGEIHHALPGGGVYTFYGDQEYVEVSDNDVLDLSDEFEIVARVTVDDRGGRRGIFTKYAEEGNRSFSLEVRDSKPVFVVVNDEDEETVLQSSVKLTLGQAATIKASLTEDTLSIYVDDVLTGQIPYTDTIKVTEAPVRIGGLTANNPKSWEGTIDYITLFTYINEPPVAVIGAAPTQGYIPFAVQFDGTGSNDPDGWIERYEWDYDGDGIFDESGPDLTKPVHIYTAPGTYLAGLRVKDNGGEYSEIATIEITVSENQPPNAVIIAEPTSGDTELDVMFDGSASFDPDGEIIRHEWDFNFDGIVFDADATGEEVSYTYETAGIYTAALRVTDDGEIPLSSIISIQITVTEDITPPGEVSNFTAVSGDEEITLSWGNPIDDDFEGLRILRKAGSAPENITDGVVVYEGRETLHTDGGLTNGTHYFYTAFTYDEVPNYSSGASADSIPADVTGPADVTSFSAISRDGKIILTWTKPANSDLAGVVIRRAVGTAPSTPAEGVEVYNGVTESCLDIGLSNGTQYFYTAFSYDEVPNYSAGTSVQGIPADVTPPRDVSLFTAESGDTQITLTWTNPLDADFAGVKIIRKVDSVPEDIDDGIGTFDGTGTSHTDTGLTNGTHYFYTAFTYDEVPNYSVGVNADAVPADVTAPADISDFMAISESGTITLSWTNPGVADFAGVKILRKIDSAPLDINDGAEVYDNTGEGYTDAGLTNGTHYFYTAFTYDEVPNYSGGTYVDAAPTGVPPIVEPILPVPNSQASGGQVLFSVLATDDDGTIVSVEVDLSAIHGSSVQTMYDDGTHGDVTAGDNIYSYLVTIGTDVGTKILSVKVKDDSGGVKYVDLSLEVSELLVGYPDKRVDTDTAGVGTSEYPQIVCSGDKVYVTWRDYRNGQGDIYFNYSTDKGVSWNASDIRLDKDMLGEAGSDQPKIAAAGDNVYVVWYDRRNDSGGSGTKYDIYFNYSHNGGETWLTDDMQINTNTPGLSFSAEPRIACSGNNVYIAWIDDRNNGWGQGDEYTYRFSDVYFNYSTDGGETWQSSDIRINTELAASASCTTLQITCSEDNIYVVWSNNKNGLYDIYFNYSTDGGANWNSSDIRLDKDTAGSAESFWPHIVSSGNKVYVTWQDERSGVKDVYFNYSHNNGATWRSQDIRLDTDIPDVNESWRPIACTDGRVYVTWHDNRNGPTNVFLNYSEDGGETWQSSDTRLDMSLTGNSIYPRISCFENNVYVVWFDSRNGQRDIYLNYSNDKGGTWQSCDIRFDTDEAGKGFSYLPQICGVNDNIYIIWSDFRNGNSDIYFNNGVYNDITPPQEVDSFIATPGYKEVLLSWTLLSDFERKGFTIIRKAGSAPHSHEDGIVMYNAEPGVSGTYLDSGLVNGIEYHYMAFSYDAEGNKSAGVVEVAIPIPVEVISFQAFPGQEQVFISWQNPLVADFEGVLILRNVSSILDAPANGIFYNATDTIGTSTVIFKGSKNDISYLDINVIGGTHYYYKAFTFDIVSNYSVGVNADAVALDNTSPGEVSLFEAIAGDEQITLSWGIPADSDFAGVMIRRSTEAYPPSPTEGILIYNDTGTSFPDTGLINNTHYFYTAFTYDGVPNYSSGTSANARPTETGLADVTGFSGIDGNAAPTITSYSITEQHPVFDPTKYFDISLSWSDNMSINLSWTNPTTPNFVGVKIIRKEWSAPVNINDGIKVYDASGEIYTDTYDIANNTHYFYAAFTTFDGVTYSGGKIIDVIISIFNYNIYRSIISGSGYGNTGDGPPSGINDAHTYLGVESHGITYYYVITVSGSDNYESNDSNEVSVIPQDTQAPGRPTLEFVIPVDSSVYLNWSSFHEFDHAGYNIYRREEGDTEYRYIETVFRDYEYTDTSIVNSKVYYYVVTQEDHAEHESPYSNEKCLITKPVNMSVVFDEAYWDRLRILVNWDDIPGVDGYNLYRSTDPVNGYQRIDSFLLSNAHTDSDLEFGTTYYYVVKGVIEPDIESPYSTAASTSTVEVPSIPYNLNSIFVYNNMNDWYMVIDWQSDIAVKGYNIYRSDSSSPYKRIHTDFQNKIYYDTTIGVYGLFDYVIRAVKYGYETPDSASTGLFTAPPDSDGDDLDDYEEETIYGTDPNDSDTDDDGLSDGFEVNSVFDTDPLTSDTDADGLTDFDEVMIYHTNPHTWDTDGDWMSDLWEVTNGTDAHRDDADEDIDDNGVGDGLTNFEEMIYNTNPTNSDPDGDGVSDYEEIFETYSNPNDPNDFEQKTEEDIVRIELAVGDDSESKSERWQMIVSGNRRYNHQSKISGVVFSDTYTFDRGEDYTIKVGHIDSTEYPPDYDWDAYLDSMGYGVGWMAGNEYLIYDPQDLLGKHYNGTSNHARGKTAWLCIPKSSLEQDIIPVNDGNVDADTEEAGKYVPNFADGFDKWAENKGEDAGGEFTPLTLILPEPLNLDVAKIKFTYSCSNPDGVTRDGLGTVDDPYVYEPAAGRLRIWNKDGSADRLKAEVGSSPTSGNFVNTTKSYVAKDLSAEPLGDSRTITLYVEGIHYTPTANSGRITVAIDPDGSGPAGIFVMAGLQCAVIKVEFVDMQGNVIDGPVAVGPEVVNSTVEGVGVPPPPTADIVPVQWHGYQISAQLPSDVKVEGAQATVIVKELSDSVEASYVAIRIADPRDIFIDPVSGFSLELLDFTAFDAAIPDRIDVLATGGVLDTAEFEQTLVENDSDSKYCVSNRLLVRLDLPGNDLSAIEFVTLYCSLGTTLPATGLTLPRVAGQDNLFGNGTVSVKVLQTNGISDTTADALVAVVNDTERGITQEPVWLDETGLSTNIFVLRLMIPDEPEGGGEPSEGYPFESPGLPENIKFRVVVYDSSNKTGEAQITLRGLDFEGNEIDVRTITLKGSPFISDPIVAVRGEVDPIAKDAYPEITFIDPIQLDADYKGYKRRGIARYVFLMHSDPLAPALDLIDETQPDPLDFNLNMDLYVVILAQPIDSPEVKPQYFCSGTGLPSTIDVREGDKKVTRELYPWKGPPATFSWSYVEPVPPATGYYSNTDPWWRGPIYAKLKYESVSISGVGSVWHIPVGGVGNIGVRRYTVKATFTQGSTTYTINSPDHTVLRDTVGDNGISDNVMRVVIKGNYPGNDFLQWVASFQEVPFIMGSNGEHQVDKYIGTDCADLVAGAMRKMGKKASYSNWYADGLYKMAIKGEHFTVVTSRTTAVNSVPEPQPGDIVLWEFLIQDPPPGQFSHTTVFEKGGIVKPVFLSSDDNTIYASDAQDKVTLLNYSGLFSNNPVAISVIRLKP